LKEVEAFNLAKIYLSFYKSHTNKHFHLGSVKKTKWWKFFLEVVEKFGDKKEWNPHVFIWAQFEKYDKIFPTQLPTDAAWSLFLDYRNRFQSSQKSEISMAKNLLNTYNMVKRWSLDNGYKGVDFKAFFNNPYNMIMIERYTYDLTLFTLTKSFQECMELNKNILTEEEFNKKRALIFNNKKVLYKIKEVLGNEFV